MLKLCIRIVCLLAASLMATHALSQDLSGWSDKTVCRLLSQNPDNTDYFEEGVSRGLACASSTQKSANDDTQTSDNTEINVTNKPRGVLSSSNTKKQWNAYKHAKECLKHPTYAASQSLTVRLLSGEKFASTEWRVPFNNASISNEEIELTAAPEPFGKITLDETYGEQNQSVEVARQWFASAAQTLRLTNNKKTQDQFKSVLVDWATANALNKGLHVSWGAKPVDWHVMTSIGAILTSTALIADTLSSEERAIVGPWLNRLVTETAASHWYQRSDNKAYMRAYYTMIWAFMTGDNGTAQKAIDIYKLAIHDMRPDGSFPNDSQRGGMGINYNSDALSYLVMMAALVNTNTDQNLVDYTVDGRSIHSAVNFVVKSINEPSATNRLYAIKCPGSGDRWGSVESPNRAFIQKASYLMVYADMIPNAEHGSWIRDRYLSSEYINLAVNVIPQLLFYPSKLDPHFKKELSSKLVDNQPVLLDPLDQPTTFDGDYPFVLSRFNPSEGLMALGSGILVIKNGTINVSPKDRRLDTGPTKYYDTLKGQIYKKGNTSVSFDVNALKGAGSPRPVLFSGNINNLEIKGEFDDYFQLIITFRDD